MLASPLSAFVRRRVAYRALYVSSVVRGGALLQVIVLRIPDLLDVRRYVLEEEKEGGRNALRCSSGIFRFELLFRPHACKRVMRLLLYLP